MSTATQEELDLEWVTFSEEDHELKCERACKDCPNVAMFSVLWLQRCGCPVLPRYYCLSCYEALKSRPGEVMAVCATCDAVGALLVGVATPLGRK